MREYTIAEVLSYTETLERILMEKLNKSSKKSASLYKKFITRCNSLFIIFSQFDLQTTAFGILHKALFIDLKTYFDPLIIEKSWSGRVLLYINTGFFMLVVGDFASSLKFLYDAESLLMECRQGTKLTKDLTLAHSAISALAYFKNKKYDAAEKHIEVVSDEFNEIIRGDRMSRFSANACCNIYCLTTLFLDVLKARNSELASTTNCKVAAKKMRKKGVASVTLLDEFNENPTFDNGSQLVSSGNFRKILAATILFPFISRQTPIVQSTELKGAQEHARDNRLVKSQLANYLKRPYKSIEYKDFYALLMTESIHGSAAFNKIN